MAVAADPVEDNTRDADARIEVRKTEQDRCCRLRLPRDIEYEQNRQAKLQRKLRGRAVPDPSSTRAIEQAHGRFDYQEISAGRCLMGDAVEERRPHGPAVEIEAGRAGRGGVEGRVYIVWAAFGRADAQATAAKGGEKRKGHGGLARA